MFSLLEFVVLFLCIPLCSSSNVTIYLLSPLLEELAFAVYFSYGRAHQSLLYSEEDIVNAGPMA